MQESFKDYEFCIKLALDNAKKRKRKNAFKRFEAKLKENAFRSYGRINITKAR